MSYHEDLRKNADEFAHEIYTLTKKLPKEEIFGITSQLRRASLSVILNIVEGYARKTEKSYRNFLLISYGSLKESSYLVEFCVQENLFSREDAKQILSLSDKIDKMLWGIIKKI